MFFYLGEPSEARFAAAGCSTWKARDRLTDPQWVVAAGARRAGSARSLAGCERSAWAWLVTLVGYLLGLVSLILSVPLIVGTFLTPYRLSRDKFYFDEIYYGPGRLAAADRRRPCATGSTAGSSMAW